jgi:hypothetical protein
VDDYVDCGSDESLKILGDITISFWLNPFDWGTSQQDYVLNNNLYRIYHRGWAGARYFYFLYQIEGTDSPGDSDWGGRAGVRCLTSLQDGIWYFATAVKSGDYMSLYINGIEERKLNAVGGYTIDTSTIIDLTISGGTYFNGLIDEVRIYSEAIPSTEIQKHYVQGLGRLLANQAITQAEYNQRIEEFNQSLVLNRF